MMILFFKLLIGHAVADYALQSDQMAFSKRRKQAVHVVSWYYWMTAHALINAGAVWIVTGSAVCALAEFILHWFIDFAKCENWTNPHADQFLHVLCKLAYVGWLRNG